MDSGKPIEMDRMDSGEAAYIFKNCVAEKNELYVKVKFFREAETDKMLIISAHPDRRW